ncbi:MAG: hypothetical protein ACK4UJ_00265 [Leptonema sp. (in: bacteria)]
MKKIDKKIIYIIFFVFLLATFHLFYIFSYLPKNLIFLTLAIDFLGFLVFIYLIYKLQALFLKENKQKDILIEILKDEQEKNQKIVLAIKSFLEMVKDSHISKNFLIEYQKDPINNEQNLCDKLNEKEVSFEELIKETISCKDRTNRLFLFYVENTKKLIEQFTTVNFFKTLFTVEINLNIFEYYIEAYFKLLNKVYEFISNFAKEFHMDSKIIQDELSTLQKNINTIKKDIESHSNTIDEFIEFFKEFTNQNINFIDQISKDYEKNLEILKNIQEISEKIKMLSLNLSIEASRTSSNKVFDVLSEELQSFSHRIQNFSFRIREEILQTNEKAKEETEIQIKKLENIKFSVENLTSLRKSIVSTFLNFEEIHKNLIIRSKEVLTKSEQALQNFFNNYQNLKIIEESFKNIFSLLKTKNNLYEENVESSFWILFKEDIDKTKIIEETLREYAKMTKTEIELNVLLSLCDKFNIVNLKKELQNQYTKSDVILF